MIPSAKKPGDEVMSPELFIREFSETQKSRLSSVEQAMEERYGSIPTSSSKMSGFEFVIYTWLGIKKRWYWFLVLPVLFAGYFVAWYVCSGLLFFILLGMVLGYFLIRGSSLWFIDFNAKGEMTPISVGVDAYVAMRKAEEPAHFFNSRQGDHVLPVWDFQRGKPVKPACTMLRDPWMALYDIKKYAAGDRKLEQMMARENRMFMTEQMYKEEAVRNFSGNFSDMVERVRYPAIVREREKRQLQTDIEEVRNILRAEELGGVRGGGSGD